MDITADLTDKTELELRAMERAIAKKHLDKFLFVSVLGAWQFPVLAVVVAVGDDGRYAAMARPCHSHD